ncbi:hypothetical protein TWF106_002860 [Orbilia oligospora]|uniref:Cytochrome b561 domain-containing protein n=1 Tax=Orbilia oligospora TaxID=2813651 RepID=A0A7C8U668_ORBOL|nr:hypothetical protein TWF106_002860 [Orbilia oligospora]
MKLTKFYSLALLFACQALASSAPPESSLQQRTAPEFGSPALVHNVLPESLSKRQNVDGPDSAAGEPGHGGRRTIKTTPAQRRTFRIAHGTIMGVAFTIGFPSGAIFIRVLKPPNHVYIHAATQIFSTAMAFTGMGLGIWLGLNVRYLDYLHTIIGFAVMACLVIQPIIGLIHHIRYKKVKRSTWWGFVHRWTRAVEKSMQKQKKDYMEPAGESREAVGLMPVS